MSDFAVAAASLNSGGTLTLTNSTVSGNSARHRGGGVYNNGTATLTNSTVSGNDAYYGGGGVFNSGTLTLTNSTVSGNNFALRHRRRRVQQRYGHPDQQHRLG